MENTVYALYVGMYLKFVWFLFAFLGNTSFSFGSFRYSYHRRNITKLPGKMSYFKRILFLLDILPFDILDCLFKTLCFCNIR